MPTEEATTNQLLPASDDFICTRENVLWLMSQQEIYSICPAFRPLENATKQLSSFIKRLSTEADTGRKCSRCSAIKITKSQNTLLDAFAGIFLRLYDTGRIKELQTLKEFVAKTRAKSGRLILSYSGKSAQNKERLVVI